MFCELFKKYDDGVQGKLLKEAQGSGLPSNFGILKPLELLKGHLFWFNMILKMVRLNRVSKEIISVCASIFLKYFWNTLWKEGNKIIG